MFNNRIPHLLGTLTGVLFFASNIHAQVDPNFHIYLAFGQSNMEGQGIIAATDRTVNSRFQVIEAVNCTNLSRTKGSWYTAVPPLVRCYTGLSPLDYFGRTLVDSLPTSIKVGVVPVAVAGSKIELFDKVNYASYAATVESWMKTMINDYGGNPYGRLVEMAKLAQQKGVIKGILLHQGESNVGDAQWTTKVKGVYDNLIKDLGLDPTQVPLLAGEVVNASQGGSCASMNTTINQLPQKIPNSYVISSAGVTDTTDNLHFNAAGYRELGRRYAQKMLTLLKVTPVTPPKSEVVWLEPECNTVGTNWDRVTNASVSNGSYVAPKTGLNSLASAPTGTESYVVLPFTIDSAQTFYVHGRINAATADDDSYWMKLDNASFTSVNGLATSGWEWKAMDTLDLTKGAHTLTIAYREDGAQLDKISISNSATAPTGMGGGSTCSVPVNVAKAQMQNGYGLDLTASGMAFSIPEDAYVSLTVYSLQGGAIAEIAAKQYSAGSYAVAFDASAFPQGTYYVTMQANGFTTTRRLVSQGR